jgi:serine/threonine protein phosphatase PrpC
MGAALTYLSGPEAVTTVKIDHQPWDKSKPVSSAAASMQGWRRSMEDAHFMKYFPEQNVYLFGVFDGHGGSGVSRYCAQRFPELIESNENFKARNFDIALHESFLDLDLETQEPNVQETLFQLHIDSKNNASDSDSRKIQIHLSFETILDLFLGNPSDPVNHPPDPFKVFLDDYVVPNPLDIPISVPPTPVQVSPESTPAPSPGPPAQRKRRSATLRYGGGSQAESDKFTTEPKSPWGDIATILRRDGRVSDDLKMLIESFDPSLGLAGGTAEGDPPPLLRLKPADKIDWSQSEEIMRDPLKVFFEGTLASLLRVTTDIPWVYSIHPIELLAALNNNHLVVEEDEETGARKIRRCVSDDQGCTANVCLLSVNESPAPLLFCANAGDSRAIVVRSNDQGTAKAVPLSIDHKPSLPGERRRVLHAGGRIVGRMDPRVQGDLNLSRAIGDWRHKQNLKLPIELQMISPRPDITITEIGKNDRHIVLGCDGIWERFSSADCADFVDILTSNSLSPRRRIFLQHHYGINVRGESNIESVCSQICQATVRKPDEFPGMPVGVTIGCDNMSVVVVAIGKELRENIPPETESTSPSTLPVITYGAQVPDDWHPPETRKRLRKGGDSHDAKRKKSTTPSPDPSE